MVEADALPSVAGFVAAQTQRPAEAPRTPGGPSNGLSDEASDRGRVRGDNGIGEIRSNAVPDER
jgi:hypothetical protein